MQPILMHQMADRVEMDVLVRMEKGEMAEERVLEVEGVMVEMEVALVQAAMVETGTGAMEGMEATAVIMAGTVEKVEMVV